MIRVIKIMRTLTTGKKMESSRRYLLQAEIQFWHEMLSLNKDRLPEETKTEMEECLRQAVQHLNEYVPEEYLDTAA